VIVTNFDLSKCDPVCHECVKRYEKKYGSKTEKFNIGCKGIPKEYISQEELKRFPPNIRDKVIATLDPVSWARLELNWEPRWYQTIMLKCSSTRKVSRIGRQCLTEDAYLLEKTKGYTSIKDLKFGDIVLSMNNEKHSLEWKRVINQWVSGEKKVYKIRTKFGHEIVCSAKHPFYAVQGYRDKSHNKTIDKLEHGWVSIKDGLSEGDKIAVAHDFSYNDDIDSELPDELFIFLGYFIADGTASIGQSAKFTNIDMSYLIEFEEVCKALETAVKWYKKGKGYDLIITNGRRKKNPIRDMLGKYGLLNIRGPEKTIPQDIFKGSKRQIALFLNRLWAADGYISTFKRTGRSTYRSEIEILEESKVLLKQTQQLLYLFGIHGYIKEEGNCYRLVISNKLSIINFLTRIGPVLGKEEACDRALNNMQSITDKYAGTEGEVLWDYISSIEMIGIEQTYDIEVEDNHNFIANGFVTHNSGKSETLAITALYYACTRKDFHIVILTPMKTHTEVLFKRLDELLRKSADLRNSIVRKIKAPIYTIELSNGSTIEGFTAGERSGGEADVVRGRSVNLLIFDEADMLSAATFDSSLATIINFPDAIVWVSSTPKGKKERFYKCCVESPDFQEFHYPSQVNPNWGDEQEQFFRDKLTDIGYKQEVLAEFSTQVEGVYQRKFVEQAMKDYHYKDEAPQPGWIYCVGVDWNDVEVGTRILVVGYNPAINKFRVVSKDRVSKEGWNQVAAMRKIRDINRLWNPSWIYVDARPSPAHIEMLRLYGAEAAQDPQRGPNHPDVRLKDIVKGYEFGSKIETHDIFSKEKVKRPAKVFLVENSVRRFEASQVEFPKEDTELEAQLLGYIIDRYTTSGIPIYKAGNTEAGDHDIDAMNLALIGFTLEMTILGKPRWSGRIGIVNEPLGAIVNKKEEEEASIASVQVIKEKKKKILREARIESLPSLGRGELRSDSIWDRDLPANNTNTSHSRKLWSWPGWERDDPAPRWRRRSGLLRARGKPSRKNI